LIKYAPEFYDENVISFVKLDNLAYNEYFEIKLLKQFWSYLTINIKTKK